METMKLQGGCLCGNLRYDFETPVYFTANCHCTACQKSTGSAFSPIAAVDRDSFSIEGTSKTFYDSEADSGNNIQRCFCATCGTTVYGLSESYPNVIFLKMGTLDSQLNLEPRVNVFCRDKVSWIQGINELPTFDLMPPRQ